MLAKRLLRKRATLQDVYRLYQVVCRTPKILVILKDLECTTINDVLCGPIEDTLKVSQTIILPSGNPNWSETTFSRQQ